MSLAAVMMICAAVTLTSCGGDDEGSKSPLAGTTWKTDFFSIKLDGGTFSGNAEYRFGESTVTGHVGDRLFTTDYSMSADNKTVYMVFTVGNHVGTISSDGKTMDIKIPGAEGSITVTKQ